MPIDVDALIRDQRFQGISPEAQQRFFLDNIASGEIDAKGRETLITRGLLPKDAPTTAQFAGQGSVVLPQPTLMQRLGTAAKEAGPSVVGSVVGEMAGPFVGLPPQVGAGLGGALGEATAQLAGINPKNTAQVALAAAVPTGAKVATAMLPKVARLEAAIPTQNLARRLPGSAAALSEMAREEIVELPGNIRAATAASLGGQTVDDLFALAKQTPTPIPTGPLTLALTTVQEAEAVAARSGTQFGGKLRRLTTSLQQLADEGAQPLEVLDTARRRLGALIGTETNPELRGLYKTLYKGIMDSLDEAADAGVPGAAMLKRAVAAQRRYFAADDLEELINKPGMIGPPRPDGLREIRVGKMLDELDRAIAGAPSKNMRLFVDSFTGQAGAQELAEIRDVLAFWSERVTPLPPARGVTYGSGPTVGLGAMGYLVGGAEGTAMAIGGQRALALLLSTRPGRAALKERLTQDFPISATELVLMAVGQEGRTRLGDPIAQSRELMGNLRGQQPQLTAPRQP
jgi:hypothetical protein